MLTKRATNLFPLYVLLCCSLLSVCTGCRENAEKEKKTEFEIDKNYQRGPLTVHVRVDKAKATIAEINRAGPKTQTDCF